MSKVMRMLKKQEYWHAKREKEMAGGGRKKRAERERELVWEIAKFDKFVKSFTVSFLCAAEHEETETACLLALFSPLVWSGSDTSRFSGRCIVCTSKMSG